MFMTAEINFHAIFQSSEIIITCCFVLLKEVNYFCITASFNIHSSTDMKKIFMCLMMTLVGVIAFAKGKAEITFDTTAYDFGTIKENGGKVTAVYQFTNTGDEPLTIVTVSNGGCGCTKPDFPKAPIAPGAKGEIKVTFQPKGRSGEFNRSVKVKTNAGAGRKTLTFNGVIVP